MIPERLAVVSIDQTDAVEVIEMLELVESQLARLSALRESSLPSMTLDGWADQAGCLFVACPMDQAPTLAPVVVGLVSAAIAAQRRRHNGDALVLIDELANIAPLPDLPSWLAELRSWDVTIVGAPQSWGQLTKWGRSRQAVEQAWPWLALFNGITDTGLVQELSKARGDQIVTRQVLNTGTSSQWHTGGRWRRPPQRHLPAALVGTAHASRACRGQPRRRQGPAGQGMAALRGFTDRAGVENHRRLAGQEAGHVVQDRFLDEIVARSH